MEGLQNIAVLDFLHGDAFRDALAISDCALVTLEKGATGLCVPSKTYSYMMQGIPIVAIMDECDIVRDLEAGAGCHVGNGESAKLTELLKAMAREPEKLREMGRKCRECYVEKYTAAVGTGKYVTLFRSLLAK